MLSSYDIMAFDIQELEEKLKEHREMSDRIRACEKRKKEITEELLKILPRATRKYETPHFKASRQERVNIRTSLEDAKALHATKTEEVVDKEKIKSMYISGQQIPGITKTEFFLVKAIEK